MVQAVIPTTVVGLQGRPVSATPAPTNNQALIWNGSAWVPGGPYLTAAGAPYVAINYVDNSGFIINQRAYSSGTALAAGAYGPDRWKAGASGCTLTFTASPASTVVTISAGTLQQVIEGVNFINSTYVLSWLGSATGRVNTGAYVVSPITFTGAPNTNVTIEFQGGTLGQVQLQIGNQATLWQPLSAGDELLRCQRFYIQTPAVILGGAAFGGAGIAIPIWFPTTMRTTPTVQTSWTAGSGYTASAPGNISNYSFAAQAGPTVGSGAAGGFVALLSYIASADL